MTFEFVYQRDVAELLRRLGFRDRRVADAAYVIFEHPSAACRLVLPGQPDGQIPLSMIEGYRSELMRCGLLDELAFDQWHATVRQFLSMHPDEIVSKLN